jgi:uncharacterized protein DUF5398
MFGLESQKKKKPEEFVFELEKEIKNPTTRIEIQKNIESKLQTINDMLRTGENKEYFEQLAKILYGYQALVKVISRVISKRKL